MKISVIFAVLLTAIFSLGYSVGHTDFTCSQELVTHGTDQELCNYDHNFSRRDVISFDLDNLEINSNGIFINHHGEWVQLRSITQDNHGNFMGATDEWSFTWQCPNCSYKNSPFTNTCANCGYKPPR